MNLENEADWDTLEMQNAARDAANGVCHVCDDALNPLDARWNGTTWPRTRLSDGTYRATTAAEYADIVGPVHESGIIHERCTS